MAPRPSLLWCHVQQGDTAVNPALIALICSLQLLMPSQTEGSLSCQHRLGTGHAHCPGISTGSCQTQAKLVEDALPPVADA